MDNNSNNELQQQEHQNYIQENGFQQEQEHPQQHQQQEFDQDVETLDNLDHLSPEQQQEYILLLQDKLQNLQSQLTQNSQNASLRTSQKFSHRSPQQNPKSFKSQQQQQCPQYPRAYQDWILKQSISPQKYQQELKQVSSYFQNSRECTFEPKVCEKSRKIANRDIGVSPEKYMKEYLYQDALNRKEKTQNIKKKINEDINMEQNKSKIGLKSQTIVLRKIEDTLNLLLNEISEENQVSFENLGLFYQELGLFKVLKFQKSSQNETSLYLSGREKVNLQRLGLEMQFHEQIWKILTNNNKLGDIPRNVIFDVTMVLLEKRLYISKSVQLLQQVIEEYIDQNQEQNQDQQQKEIKEEGDGNEEEKPTWTLEQLITEFRSMFEDKTSFMEYYGSRKPILSSIKEDSKDERKFQPEICKKSKKIDYINNQNSNRYDLLYAHSKYLQEKKIEQKVKSELEELQKCTFHPTTNANNNHNFPTDQEFSTSELSQTRHEKLYSLNDQKLQKIQEKKLQQDYQNALEEQSACTFKPKKYSQVPLQTLQEKSVVEEVKGSSLYIQRNQKARIDKEFQDSYWDRKRESYLAHDCSQTTNAQPFSFSQSNWKSFRRDRGELLGNVDVNYARGKKAKIAIYRGDDAGQCAAAFAKIHGLSIDMTICLTEMLEKYIKSFDSQQGELQQQQFQSQQEDGNEIDIQNNEVEPIDSGDQEQDQEQEQEQYIEQEEQLQQEQEQQQQLQDIHEQHSQQQQYVEA